MKKNLKKELIIGGSVLLTLLILFFGIDYLKGINVFKAANYYYASYTNVAGLAQSAPVTINGFKVGLVREVEYEYDNPGHVRVEMSLDRKLRIPEGTKAVLVTDMLGTASIELKMAENSNFHEIGDKLIGETATGLMDNVTNDIMPSVAAMIPKIDSLLTAVTTMVSDPAIANSTKRLENIMANLEASSASLTRVMSSMPAIATDARATMENVKNITGNLEGVSDQLKTMPVDSIMQNAYRISATLDDLTRKLSAPDSSIGLLLNDSGLYDNLNNAAASLDSLLQDVKKNPKRYISIKLL